MRFYWLFSAHRVSRNIGYPRLVDHISTSQLPDVVGMRKNVFWLKHRNMEAGNQAEMHQEQSNSNDWEVDMVHALVRHVVRQDVYTGSDIAVLTPLPSSKTDSRQKILLMTKSLWAIPTDGSLWRKRNRGHQLVPFIGFSIEVATVLLIEESTIGS